ncbi:hypothetical protein ACFPM7_28580 [Actinokineospora guangxiensis]|uniref:Uncharacterized protein n=1 Tax=Actinokineospora guangxiensis TaxID=1490288 RepID=A0ABW0EV08_9PSEU
MDPRERAEAILARARARGAYVVTPDSATSPMDHAATVQIPRRVVHEIDDPEVTSVFAIAEDELPAIAQEAATQSLASPPRPGSAQVPAPAPVPAPEEVGGILPTTTQRADRSSLTRRLDGGF